MQTIAQQLKVTDFPFEIKNKNGNQIYYESSTGFWYRYEFDSEHNEIYCENSKGYWCKREYDSKGNEIYLERSNGYVEDNRPKTEVQKALELLEKEGMLVDGKILKN